MERKGGELFCWLNPERELNSQKAISTRKFSSERMEMLLVMLINAHRQFTIMSFILSSNFLDTKRSHLTRCSEKSATRITRMIFVILYGLYV